MSKNIGWTKKQAESMAKTLLSEKKYVEAYAQLENYFYQSKKNKTDTFQWIVVLKKKGKS